VYRYPFGSITWTGGNIDATQRRIIRSAWQYVGIMYTIPDDEPQIDLIIVTGGSSPSGTSIVGSWDGSHLTLYTESIDNDHALFLVMVHELYHVLGFGDTVFRDLTTPGKVFTGTNVSTCTLN